MLHFGYYKPRLAALSILRQPSSGCLWLKWKPIWRWEVNERRRMNNNKNEKLQANHHHQSLLSHVPQLLRKHSALLLLHVHNKSEHHHHNRHRCWSRASEQKSKAWGAKLNCFVVRSESAHGLVRAQNWGHKDGLPPAYHRGYTARTSTGFVPVDGTHWRAGSSPSGAVEFYPGGWILHPSKNDRGFIRERHG